MGTWLNSDGLYIKYGQTEATVGKAGEFMDPAEGTVHCVELRLDLAVVAASTTPYIVSDTVTIPNGAWIREVKVFVSEETAGVNANLDLGLIDQDRTTELDYNGLLAAADAFNGGTDVGTEVIFVKGTTEAGALVGTRLSNTGLVTANYDTAAFTDGTLFVTIKYSMHPATV